MDATQKKYKGQVEINDLIDEAVNNAVSRRNQVVNSQDALSVLSHEQAGSITGGQESKPIAMGRVDRPDVAIG